MLPFRHTLAALLLGAGLLVSLPASAQRSHTVRAGQSMSRIARRYHVSVWDLALANQLRPTATLRPGQTLDVPPQGVTYVRPGQTLSQIARDHDCSVAELQRLNRLRGGLRAGRRLILPGYMPEEPAAPRDWGAPAEPGVVRIRRRDEVVAVRLLDAERRVTREGLEQLAQLMRRQDEDEAVIPAPRLAVLLAAISDHYGGRELTLVSGRRPARGYTRETSRHVSGRATDIRVAGVGRRDLWDYCRTLASTGCGYYPRSTFVHVDVRAQATQWVDWSRPGGRPRYGNLARTWPAFCRNPRRRTHRLCSREGRRVSRPAEVPVEFEMTDEARALLPVAPEAPDVTEDDAIDEYETATDEEDDLES
ncbi:MAG: LysM peptidoglycan-binding domain-containing protein [Myxococcales bacterium]|nr:LysM peptidoglycan-binding domain-containing protein [Myxococcales bacterium]